MWRELYIFPGSTGPENGLLLRQEEYGGACSVTLEKCPGYYAVTCVMGGKRAHTVFCDADDHEAVYAAIKRELSGILHEATPADGAVLP